MRFLIVGLLAGVACSASADQIEVTFENGGYVLVDGKFYPAQGSSILPGIAMVSSPMSTCLPSAIGNTNEVLVYQGGVGLLSLQPQTDRLASLTFHGDHWRMSLHSESGSVQCSGEVPPPPPVQIFRDGLE